MTVHNPPKQDADTPHHEHYATEGNRKFYRPKQNRESKPIAINKIYEHELPYWEGKDHS